MHFYDVGGPSASNVGINPSVCCSLTLQAARDYVQRIEDLIGIYCKWIGVGPGRDAIVAKPKFGKC